ncbi:unnamed protein product [Lactuca saligna]|uniref:DDE Tnp4 domain-containing protein n=1 Tax=Lactuca saligna TaxID=75948 RepID=A0AA36A1V3_LACSI|nr:unnamed protein product [Lactuca saligna]
MKNKWDIMRKEFKYYDRLTRLEMGISIDPVKNTISASMERWDDKIKEDKEFAKFMDKNLDVYQTYYEALFRDTVAIGDRAKVPCEFGDNSTPNDVQLVDITDGRGLYMIREFLMKREGDVKLSKYYLVDTGYPNTKGYLAPYKGSNIRYHIPYFRRGQTSASREPKGFKEKFNYYHSSLRNIIERTFGVWKARWGLLRDMHVNFDFETQVKIVLASMAIHNYIRMSGSGDAAFQIAEEESYISRNDEGPNNGIEPHNEVSSTQRRTEDMYMCAVRDMIAGQIFSRSTTRARNGI